MPTLAFAGACPAPRIRHRQIEKKKKHKTNIASPAHTPIKFSITSTVPLEQDPPG
jgi:hypothetical protein